MKRQYTKNFLALGLILCIMGSCMACGDPEVSKETEPTIHLEQSQAEDLQYWLDKMEDPYQVLMNQDQITAVNQSMMDAWGTDWFSGYYDITKFPEKIEREWLVDRIDYLDLRHTKLFYKGEAVTEAQWDAYYEAMALEQIQEETTVSYGVIVHNTPMLDLPTEDILTDSSLNEASNALQQTMLKINEPVVVIHESTDGQWLYVAANEYMGWIPQEDCAYFADRAQWLEYQTQEDFIVVTADGILYGMNEATLMGTKLYVKEDQYAVPGRDESGKFMCAYAELAEGEHFCMGYLPYSRGNVLRLAFQQLGEPYGWGGKDGKRDCSSYIKDIYACFGFQLPRNSRIQQSMPQAEDMTAMTEAEKADRMESAQPGDILGISGHVMLYLGRAGSQDYVISMLGSYVPETVTENFADHVETVNCVTVNTLDVKRKNGNTWLQELRAIVNLE